MAIDGTIVANVTFDTATTGVYHEFMVASVSNVTFLCLLRDSSNSVPFISAISFSFLPAKFFDSTVYGFLYGSQRKYFETKYRLNFGGDGLVRYVIIFSSTMFFPTWPVGLHVEIKLQ
jgi:hypothetical protein